uniref:CCHC-type domain-containing protein n=1 Tax=Trichuris muris TaxID=70415 RepID=A0A5S6Q5Z6_TRIMR
MKTYLRILQNCDAWQSIAILEQFSNRCSVIALYAECAMNIYSVVYWQNRVSLLRWLRRWQLHRRAPRSVSENYVVLDSPPKVELVSTSRAKYGFPSRNTEAQRDKAKPCYRCNGRHAQQNCQFRNVDCRFCGKKGHIERACRAKAQQKSYSEPRQRNAAGNGQVVRARKNVSQAGKSSCSTQGI